MAFGSEISLVSNLWLAYSPDGMYIGVEIMCIDGTMHCYALNHEMGDDLLNRLTQAITNAARRRKPLDASALNS